MSTDKESQGKTNSLFRNWFSLFGLVIGIGSLFSFIFLYVLDYTSKGSNPYLSILTFVVCPAFLSFGVFLMLVGWFFQRRNYIKGVGKEPFFAIDFSRPQTVRNMAIFLACAAMFLLLSAIGSYRAFHFAESVAFCGQTCHEPMKPEFTTYLHSPHAKVACTACHVGPGVASFVKAKLNGVNQLKGAIFNNFNRPIPAPQHMPGAQATCEHCHWPMKYVGNVEKTYIRYLTDETNTTSTFRMLMKVGGGDPTHGPVGGIHWHMNLGNKVEYISTNANRQSIEWVRFTGADGKSVIYRSPGFKEDPSKFEMRTMDCLDCHNRPAHQFRSPGDSVDLALSLGRIDPAIPFVKSNTVAVLTRLAVDCVKTNMTEADALQTIDATLKKAYPQEARIAAVIKETQAILSRSIFPEMKASWRAYPDNIGHKNWPGCFRCHDGEHKTEDGKKKIEASNCNDCHIMIAQGAGEQLLKLSATGLKFEHPDPSSPGEDANCTQCHAPE